MKHINKIFFKRDDLLRRKLHSGEFIYYRVNDITANQIGTLFYNCTLFKKGTKNIPSFDGNFYASYINKHCKLVIE